MFRRDGDLLTESHMLAHRHTHTCFRLCAAIRFGLQRSVCGYRKHDCLKRRAVRGKRIALLNYSQALMNVAGDMWGETNSNCHIMKSAQCLVSKETLNWHVSYKMHVKSPCSFFLVASQGLLPAKGALVRSNAICRSDWVKPAPAMAGFWKRSTTVMHLMIISMLHCL